MFKKFWNTPWTWGTYIKLCGACLLCWAGWVLWLLKPWGRR